MLWVIPALIIFSSCANSFYPLADAQHSTTDLSLEGKWSYKDGKVIIERFRNTRLYNENKDFGVDNGNLEKAYLVTIYKQQDTSQVLASLVQLGQQQFLDMMPFDTTGSSWTEEFPVFAIAKVERSDKQNMTIRFANTTFIEKQIESQHLRIAHEANNLFGSMLITTTTMDLQAFMQKYANDPQLFSNDLAIILNR